MTDKIPPTIIPAQPGWQLVSGCFHEGKIRPSFETIIAWQIDPEEGVLPMTVDGLQHYHHHRPPLVIKDPAGGYHIPTEGSRASNIADVLDFFEKEWNAAPLYKVPA